MRCRLDEADKTILLAQERLHEHNIIDENLSAMLAKVKMQSEAELRRFKEESEISYQNGVWTVTRYCCYFSFLTVYMYTILALSKFHYMCSSSFFPLICSRECPSETFFK